MSSSTQNSTSLPTVEEDVEQKTDSSVGEFSWFPLLPPEIRLIIWEYLLNDVPIPGVVHVYFHGWSPFKSQRRARIIFPPASANLFNVNMEAREVVKQQQRAQKGLAEAQTRSAKLTDQKADQETGDAANEDDKESTSEAKAVARGVSNNLGKYMSLRFTLEDTKKDTKKEDAEKKKKNKKKKKKKKKEGEEDDDDDYDDEHEEGMRKVIAQTGQPFIILGYHDFYWYWGQNPEKDRYQLQGRLDSQPEPMEALESMGNFVMLLDSVCEVMRKICKPIDVSLDSELTDFYGPLKNRDRKDYVRYGILIDGYDNEEGPPRWPLKEVTLDDLADEGAEKEQKDKMKYVLQCFDRWDKKTEERAGAGDPTRLRPPDTRVFLRWDKK
ncbi:hypothetical protein HD806DRAFT_529761 [Xylariaceae sp. AK1471]|nr:hypothetical protein HD806DRAFT_529761 [Xylariaceae sp. AK1471]